jgi:glycosyltransferase involved in cell wall biosynthesis
VASVADQAAPSGTLQVEHIIHDAGTPGIEEFAREVGADFHRDGTLVFSSKNPKSPSHLAIHCEKDAGMYDAVNRGFSKASGDVIAYLNCDEQYLPGALPAVAERFRDDAAVHMLFADAVVAREDGSFLCFRKAQVPFRDQLWFRMPVLSCATFMRREVFSKTGVKLDETKKVIGDVIWIQRAQNAGVRMGVLRRFTSLFTETEQNLGVGGAADREFLEFRRGMPGHVRRFLKLYELYHKTRSLFSGTRHHPPFAYEAFTKLSPAQRQRFHVARPTATWHGRTETDRQVVKCDKERAR